MDKTQQLLDYLQADLKQKMQQVIDGKLSIDDFIAQYSGQKEQYEDIKRKAELDPTVQLLVNLAADLLSEIASLKEAKADSDALIKRLSSENDQLKSSRQIEDSKDAYDRWKKEFDKWKDVPYYLHAPSDWPPGFQIDSLFDSIFGSPHYKQSNKS